MINLIPSEIKSNQRASSRVYSLSVLYVVVIAGLILSAMAFSTLNLVMSSKNSETQNEIDTLISQQKKEGDISVKAAFIEERVKLASQYRESRAWDSVLQTIADATPTGIQLTSLKIAGDATKGTSVTLAGLSVDRRSTVLFKDKLTENENFLGPVIQSIASGSADSGGFSFTILLTLKDKSFPLEATQ